ncbi:MAG: diguanylate cyclase [Dehalococcoidia bacterium]|nr:diguanylate cyclase [Dehalococcoidia bacterium]
MSITNFSFILNVAVLLAVIPLLVKAFRASRIVSRPLLLAYLLALMLWTGVALLSRVILLEASLQETVGSLAGLWVLVCFCGLVCSICKQRAFVWMAAGYASIAVLAGTAFSGSQAPGYLQSWWPYTLAAVAACFAWAPVFYLRKARLAAVEPQDRDRTLYLLLGALLAAAAGYRIGVPSLPGYPIEHAGHALNAALATFVLTSTGLPDPRSVARMVLVYLLTSILIAPLYSATIWALYYFGDGFGGPAGIAAIAGMIFILPWLLVSLKPPVRRTVDRFMYGERLPHREMALSFPRRIDTGLNLAELARNMLQPMPGAVSASFVSLLLPMDSTAFISRFTNNRRNTALSGNIAFSSDSPIIKWLSENDQPLLRGPLESAPEFSQLREAERDIVRNEGIGMLVPLKSRGRLVGILAVGEKLSRRPYSSDEVRLLAKVSGESAGLISNALLYTVTRESAHTDELTGLLNHGYFHQRVDEEVSRCCRFGSVFSVLFLDIDLFKSYNDAFGHLAGDDILRRIAYCIKDSIRSVDIAFRYGGDEFAVVLPESSVDDAFNVAERIRRRIESEMYSRGIALSCSIGVAAWPIHGATREKVLQAADMALYQSKDLGRNRITIASELDYTRFRGVDVETHEVLSAVRALAATVDAKDPNTYGHSKKTSDYAVYIAQALNYSRDRVMILQAAALLHDIGKIRIPDKLLVKSGPLRDEEWACVREHPRFGVSILKHIKSLGNCLPIIQHHHERFDGAGYPAGLAADHIPIDARILAVADAYDAMTSPRPYRDCRMAHQEAVDELARCAGTHFDPELVAVFAALWEPLDARKTTAGGLSRFQKRIFPQDTDVETEESAATPRAASPLPPHNRNS